VRTPFARSAVFLVLVLIAVALIELPVSASAQDAVAMDYQVKAAFMVNFPKYVDWPADAFASTNSPITVAVFGDENVAREFENMVQGGIVIEGHPVVLKRIQGESDLAGGGFQILFIATSERARISTILEKLKGSPVLLVGESDNFLEQGGMVNLVPKNRKIRLQINLAAARQAHLRISSRLLVAADVVKGKEN
jgi:hypothetical protein